MSTNATTGVIYAFIDRDDVVRYVGQTTERFWWQRPRAHMRGAFNPQTKFHLWLREYVAGGELPRVKVIESVAVHLLDEREQHWIAVHAATVMNTAHVSGSLAPHPTHSGDHCGGIDRTYMDHEWRTVASVALETNWPRLREALATRGEFTHHERKAVMVVHAAIGHAVTAEDYDLADRVLRYAILSEWEMWAFEHNRCPSSMGHLGGHSYSGIRLADGEARARLVDSAPYFYRSSKVRYVGQALDEILYLRGSDEHVALSPRMLTIALRSAAHDYADRIIATLGHYGEPATPRARDLVHGRLQAAARETLGISRREDS